MVWFYPSNDAVLVDVVINFQSHYGLILSANRHGLLGETGVPFNPTMVWFYQDGVGVTDFVIELIRNFQSHYGLILSRQKHFQNRLEITFQSHYGLILSVLECKKIGLNEATFNPTMVWFYQYKSIQSWHNSEVLSIPLWSDFIEYRKGGGPPFRGPFQSHYGLILSTRSLYPYLHRWRSFNPTMVWFYPSNLGTTTATVANFQSHYGLILSTLKLMCLNC